MKLTHAERGKMGGLKNKEKHGKDYFKELGKKGGITRWAKRKEKGL